MHTYSLFQLNEYIRRILALNFSEPIWITAEIAQIGESRGHHFLSLVQKEEEGDEILAHCEAVLWEKTYRKLRRQLSINIHEILQAGRLVKLKAQVDFHERYGLKLIIQEIDPGYTLGQLELQRRQTIETLKKANLLDKNAQLSLPPVVQRLAVISSETAAGYQDFIQQIRNNNFGYNFQIQFFQSAMQGQQLAIELPAQIKKINRRKKNFDAVILIRGGGARLDLSAFDERVIAEHIAKCKLPVITGIGHEVDETIADLVAHTSLKTPTAVAEWLINRSMQFESQLFQYAQQLHWISRQSIQTAQINLERKVQQIQHASQRLVANQHQLLNFIESEMPYRASIPLHSGQKQLEQLEQMLHLLSIENTLQRGFTFTQKDGKFIQSADQLTSGDIITSIFQDGKKESQVK